MATFVGTFGNETTVYQQGAGPVTQGPDVEIGRPGNDHLRGAGGNDQLYGGGGNDYLEGGKGDDLVAGGTGNDILYGNDDNDTLWGGQGDDVLFGGAGDDILIGNQGVDRLIGGTGADRFIIRARESADIGGGTHDGIEVVQRQEVVDLHFDQGDKLQLDGFVLNGTDLAQSLGVSNGIGSDAGLAKVIDALDAAFAAQEIAFDPTVYENGDLHLFLQNKAGELHEAVLDNFGAPA